MAVQAIRVISITFSGDVAATVVGAGADEIAGGRPPGCVTTASTSVVSSSTPAPWRSATSSTVYPPQPGAP